jgi:hypothetical protein
MSLIIGIGGAVFGGLKNIFLWGHGISKDCF